MLVRFKEIWYGAFFGIGAVLIDAEMHSSMANRSRSQELGVIGEVMLFYRILFLGFGLFAGWLMWRSNRREREFRALQNRFHHFQSQLSALATVTYSRLQFALSRVETDTLPKELSDALQAAHEDLRRLKAIVDEQLEERN